jgi:6-oxocyclohex-1-ene-carbonyl-CoA hydrolase
MSEGFTFRSHELVPAEQSFSGKVHYEPRPCRRPDGTVAEGLHTAWITLSNPEQYNSYTTAMVKDVILAFGRASEARDVVAVVFTGEGDKAFCTGGNTHEYARYYAGRPEEYRRYMRLFNDMVTAILHCDKPVICRVNGMRIGGGQEIGMACDYSVASDLARFGQAGPKHGSSPLGGATDFLPLFVGIERALESCTLCETWSAYKALRLGLLTDVAPVLRIGERFVPNPLVETEQWLAEGRVVHGEELHGERLARGKELLASGKIDFTLLDERVDGLVTKLLMTMPGCLSQTLEAMRKHKLEHWDRNRESSRAWLGMNMLAEGAAGFRAFDQGPRTKREIDFVELRQRLARGETWSPELIESLLPRAEEGKP